MTPLHVASKKGITNVLELLFEAGADMNARDKVAMTSMHIYFLLKVVLISGSFKMKLRREF